MMKCAFQSLPAIHSALRPVLILTLLFLLAAAVSLNAASVTRSVPAHTIAEITFTAARPHANPFQDVTLDAVFHPPRSDEPLRVPAFWAGGDQWKTRYASDTTGRHTFFTECSDPADLGLHAVRGAVEITPYLGTNNLHRHGPLQLTGNRRHFVHADGRPFF